MSADSLAIWEQATRGRWVDIQTPIYTAAMWVSAHALGSPSLLAIGQSMFLAAGIVAMASAVWRLGAKRNVVVAVSVVLVLTPMVGGFSMSLWKDVPYGATFLLASARVVDTVRGHLQDDLALARRAAWSLARWCLLLVTFRQNGILVVGALVALTIVPLRIVRRQLITTLIASFAVLVLLKGVVYPVMGVQPSGSQPFLFSFLHDIAHISVEDPRVLNSEDRRLLAAVAPVRVWGESYRRFGCSSANWQFDSAFHWVGVEGRTSDFIALWFKALKTDPVDIVKHRLCAGAIAWSDTVGVLYTTSRGIDPNSDGLKTSPVFEFLDDAARTALNMADRPRFQWLTWRAPTWIYTAYALVGVTAWRRRRGVLAVVLFPLFALQLGVVAINPAQDARYMFPGLLAAVLLLPLGSLVTLPPE